MNKAIIGLQWGDEGKGKIVDYLSENFDLVVRYQGGNNAGHTVIVDDLTYKLNLIPSGAIRGKVCFLGQGVILDPDHFVEELRLFKEKIPNPIIYLSSNISLILDYHKKLDKINESILLGNSKIGTTAKGIGPAYQDKVGRKSIKLSDLSDNKILDSKLNNLKKFFDPIL
ncbi:MAG: adenylosuccinate synthetase, partial [Proteobacteria bacterium]|nr:adenylosuccinate synthetase [Pseudomonadota bacterium]